MTPTPEHEEAARKLCLKLTGHLLTDLKGRCDHCAFIAQFLASYTAEKDRMIVELRKDLVDVRFLLAARDKAISDDMSGTKQRESRIAFEHNRAENAEADSIENVRKAMINWDRAEKAEAELAAFKKNQAEVIARTEARVIAECSDAIIKGIPRDWLSKHDAEVAAVAFKEAAAMLCLDCRNGVPWEERRGQVAHKHDGPNPYAMCYAEQLVLKYATLSSAPSASEVRPACEKCDGTGWVTGHPVDFGNGPEGMDAPCPSCQRKP